MGRSRNQHELNKVRNVILIMAWVVYYMEFTKINELKYESVDRLAQRMYDEGYRGGS